MPRGFESHPLRGSDWKAKTKGAPVRRSFNPSPVSVLNDVQLLFLAPASAPAWRAGALGERRRTEHGGRDVRIPMHLELVGVPAGGCLPEGIHRVLRHHGVHDLAVVIGAAGESRSFHTYRTQQGPPLFLRASGGFVARRPSEGCGIPSNRPC